MFSLKSLFNFSFNSKKLIKKNFRKVMHNLSLEDKFTTIYEIDYWGSATKSGAGSTLASTENLRIELPKLLAQFKIRTIFDGPCGDFNWMRLVLDKVDINYIGGDIVEQLIKTNQDNYSNQKTQFIKIDLTKDQLPQADLMICRDCLFHLSYENTLNLLTNYINSNIPYLLTTTYLNNNTFKNKDIDAGHFSMIDLFSAPYNFPKETLYKINDYLEDGNPRFMILWSKAQVADAVKDMRNELKSL